MLKATVNYKVDSSGRISGFSYHDGYIASVSSREDDMIFDITATAGDRFQIHATGIYDFSINDYWKGAIVSDIHIWPLSEVSLSSINSDSGLGPLYTKRANPEHINGIVSKKLLNNKNTLLLQIDCSYGGDFSCLCAEVRVLHIL